MSDFVDIYINERDKKVPATCPICKSMLQTLEDTISAYNEGACRECYISFIEVEKYSKGKDWKPSEKEIKKWLQKKKNIFKPMYKFF